MTIGLNNTIDMTLFNNLVLKGGGSPLITKKRLISMKAFITILLKLFRKDYNLKYKKGGYYDSNDLGVFNVALKYGNLDYSKSYQFEPKSLLERSFI